MATAKTGPIPDFPKKTTIPIFDTTSKQTGTLPVPTATSFYYAGIQSIWVWWLVDLKLLQAYVDPYQITPYNFGAGKGAVNVNFFNAVAMYGQGEVGNQGLGGFNETELNVVGFASKVAANVPTGIELQEFLATGEPTKRVGNMRLWVACDSAVAVACGQQVFFENKFLTLYDYKVPCLNGDAPPTLYTWTCYDPIPRKKQNVEIYNASVDLSGLSPTQGNMSELIDLSFDTKARRPVGSRRNFFGMFNTYPLLAGNKAVKLQIGTSKHPMRTDMQKLIGGKPAVAIQTFSSPPCIAEAAGYYADL
jgi:hypothetical protein